MLRTVLLSMRHCAALLLLVAVWQVAAGVVWPSFNPNSSNVFPPPSAVLALGFELLENGDLLRHAYASVLRVAIGFSLAAVVAVPLGLTIGAWPRWGRQVSTVLEVLRPVPPFVWIPFGLLWFGVGNQETLFVIFITSIFPIVANTVAGVESVAPVLRRSALCLGASKARLYRYVILPSALPQIFVGLRVGLGFAWMVLVGAELIGSTSGLGYLILDSRNLGVPSLACLGMCVIGSIGYAFDATMRRVERMLLPWA